MSKYNLSILIPALKEEFLGLTIEDILKNKRGKTEVIIGLDGAWSEPPVADHPDVRIVYSSKNLGQRGMTNTLARLSKAKYVAKCDAHCAFDEGFDVKLMEAMKDHDDWTVVPVMRNMHIFNWKCLDCGDETYQGPEPEGCKSCDVNTPDRFEKKIIWNAKQSPQSSAYRFTPDRLQFKYFGALKKEQVGDVAETMSLQGSFFMLTREKYWELDICDESWGGWGQQGTEVALKTWLSGGTVMCVRTTWYAHMFRTQHGFAFPWGNPARQQQKAREVSMNMFFKNQWDKQTRPLSWLIERFWPSLQKEQYRPNDGDRPWTEDDLARLKSTEERFQIPVTDGKPTKGIIYYTDNQLNTRIARKVQANIRSIGLPITSASLKPMSNMGTNVVVDGTRGYLTMFRQILAALEASTNEIVFFCEHDNLYHPSHFNFTPERKDVFYYDRNWWKVRDDGLAVHWDADQVSGLCCYRELAIEYYKKRIAEWNPNKFDRKFEPMSQTGSEWWMAEYPSIDIRHNHNLTYNKWTLDHFRDKSTAVNFQESTVDKIPGWDDLQKLLE